MSFQVSGDAATTRTNLGLGDAATKTVGTASGNIPVLDGSGQIADAQVASLAASKLTGIKTVGGASIAGSGDIATLPSGGTAAQVLTSDASGTGTWQDAAGGGITNASFFKTTLAKYWTNNATWLELDNVGFSNLGTYGNLPQVGSQVLESSGVFTFPTTGLWQVNAQITMYSGSTQRREIFNIQVSTNSGSTWLEMGRFNTSHYDGGGNNYSSLQLNNWVNITNASTFRVKFRVYFEASTGVHSNIPAWDDQLPFSFIRIGDSV